MATLCWHFCYLPLVPLGTYLVLDERMRGMTTTFRGVRISFSAKSFVIAWLRSIITGIFRDADAGPAALLGFAIAFSGIKARGGSHRSLALFGAQAVVVGLPLFVPYILPGIGQATSGRAAELVAYAARGVAGQATAHTMVPPHT